MCINNINSCIHKWGNHQLSSIILLQVLSIAPSLPITKEELMDYMTNTIIPEGVHKYQAPEAMEEDVSAFTYLKILVESYPKEAVCYFYTFLLCLNKMLKQFKQDVDAISFICR